MLILLLGGIIKFLRACRNNKILERRIKIYEFCSMFLISDCLVMQLIINICLT